MGSTELKFYVDDNDYGEQKYLCQFVLICLPSGVEVKDEGRRPSSTACRSVLLILLVALEEADTLPAA